MQHLTIETKLKVKYVQTKTLEMLLEEANKQIKRLSYEESLSIINEPNTITIDVREESEVINLGIIKKQFIY